MLCVEDEEDLKSSDEFRVGFEVIFVELVQHCPDNKIIMIGNSFGAIRENAVKFLTDDLLRG